MRKARSAQRSSKHCQEPEVPQGKDLTSEWLNTVPLPAGSQANPPWLGFLLTPGPSRALVRLSVRPSVPCSSCWGVQALFSQPFYLSGFLLGSFWWYPNFLGLTQRKKHFVKIAALLLNNLSSYSLFLFGRQKLNIDLWEREKRGSQGRGVEGQRGSRGGGCGWGRGCRRAGKRSAGSRWCRDLRQDKLRPGTRLFLS